MRSILYAAMSVAVAPGLLAAFFVFSMPESSRAHMSDECFAHVIAMQERVDEHAEFLSETSRMLKTYEGESVEASAAGDLEKMMGGFSRFMFAQLPALLQRIPDGQKSSSRVIEAAIAAIGCTLDEPKPVTTTAQIAPVDLDWFDGVLAELGEPPEPEAPPELPPQRVTLGVDCSEPLTVSLPDDVLTECETGR